MRAALDRRRRRHPLRILGVTYLDAVAPFAGSRCPGSSPGLVGLDAGARPPELHPWSAWARWWRACSRRRKRRRRAREPPLHAYHQAVAEWRPGGRSDVVRTASVGTGGSGRARSSWRTPAVEDRRNDERRAGSAAPLRSTPGRGHLWLDDVVYALEYVVPFRNHVTCWRWHGFTKPPGLAADASKPSAEAYGLASWDGLVDQVITGQRGQVELVRRLADRGDRRQVDLVARGYLLELQGRVQWSVTHRHLME